MQPTLTIKPEHRPGVALLKASELHKRSEAFATELVARLDRFNAEHPEPNMSAGPIASINRKAVADLSPTPRQWEHGFRNAFSRYLASRYIIIP